MSDEVLSGRLNAGDVAVVDVEDEKIVVKNKDATDEAAADTEVPAEAASTA